MTKWPKKLKHRGKVLVRVYRPCSGRDSYRVAWHGEGRRMMKSFASFSGKGGALEYAEKLLTELARHSKVALLTPGQATDALAAIERLNGLYQRTGKRVSLLGAVSAFADATARLGERELHECVEGFLKNVVTVQRKDLAEAVSEFLAGRKHLVESKDGKRSPHSPVYEYHVALWLNEFASTFPHHAVCDLSKDLLDVYMAKFAKLSVKSRNDRRTCAKMFLRWCVAKDFLPIQHRLFEAVSFKAESRDNEEIDFYRPKELRALLNAAPPAVRVVIALSGLAGLRIEECLRLNWVDVWRVPGKIEVGARIAKGRQRRLVTIGPALAEWLQPHLNSIGPVCGLNPMQLNRVLVKLREEHNIPARRNGLRHGFVTHHMALHQNETLTASEAGNSPHMLHQHYRGLTTKAEARRWFDVRPAKVAKNIVAFPKASAL
ncbi:MAG: site-specific integrase [Verrucomicrobiae bacterium]|nr:site-specific integrase [Verrucomicrobiae bacterium]